jgi:RNA-directed DNA polymerase
MSSESTMSPSGGAGSRHVMERHSLNSVTVAQVLERDNLQKAWEQVRANKGAPGIDGVTVEEFPEYARRHWEEIKTSLLAGTYTPSPVKRVTIPKDSGGTRPLGMPTVLDRVIQQAISQVLSPVFDLHFSEDSYGFRPHRSAHQAVRKVVKDIREGYRFAVDIDLEEFFDTVDHDVLMNRVARRIRDKGLLRLLGKYLRAGVEVNGRLCRTVRGVPQDGPLSPLLSNILLDDLDKELEGRRHRFARYADDCIILVKSKRAGLRVMAGYPRAGDHPIPRETEGKGEHGEKQRRTGAGQLLPRLYIQGKEADCYCQGSHEIQAPVTQAHGPELGHLHAGPVWAHPGLCQRLDELLRNRHEVYRHS